MTENTGRDTERLGEAVENGMLDMEHEENNGSGEPDEVVKLVGSVKAGDMVAFEILSETYRPLLISTVNSVMAYGSLSLAECDREDLMQEALLAIYKAACSYKAQDNVRFGLYAKVCVRNGVLNAAEKLSRQNVTNVMSEENFSEDAVDTGATPEEYLIAVERAGEIHDFMEKSLTKYERKVFLLHLAQHTYAEIAETVGKEIKSVANAISRVRAKFKDKF